MGKERVNYHKMIINFFAGEISDSEIILLKDWLNQLPENKRIFDDENELWQEASLYKNTVNYQTDTTWNNISSRFSFGKNNSRSFIIQSKINFRILVAAATIACLLALGGLTLWIAGNKSFQKIEVASTIVATHEGEKAHILLADSTEIILNSESTLQYDGHYNIKDRVVKFTGEAYFHVSTNHEKPFVVQLGKMSVTATGTRFNIFSFANEDRIETTMEDGSITVSIKGKEPINLKSGQQVVYFVKSENVLVRDVTTDTYTSWKENKLRFNNTPFEEVLRRIGRKYNVKFEITNHDLLNLKYTATFIDESIEEVMELLKNVSPITYKIYYRTTVNDKLYMKPKIVVGKRKSI